MQSGPVQQGPMQQGPAHQGPMQQGAPGDNFQPVAPSSSVVREADPEEKLPDWAVPADDDDASDRQSPRRASRAQGSRAQGSRAQGSRTLGPQALRSRARRALLRKRRRSYVLVGGILVLVAVVLVAVFAFRGKQASAVIPNALITTFQPGELQQVPNACTVVPTQTVQLYLPGKVKVAQPLAIDGKLGSACNWTVDKVPVYRLLELNLQAYAPNGLASGNGSATSAATDAYAQELQGLQHPAKKSYATKADVTMLPGLGNEAFSALEAFRAGGATTYVVTVVIRYHNVLVIAALNGLDAHTQAGVYGPVNTSQLQAAALAFAQSAEASLH
jgi:hypothetical protein